MAVTINASTSTGLVQSADTSGEIELQSNGTTALKVNTNEGIQILNCLGVGNATPSTSGAGITFPATQSASSDANTLDDYEEGTWTPTYVASGGGSVTYANQVGRYVKVGQFVFCTVEISTNSVTSLSGLMQIGGLPFTTQTGSYAGSINVAYINTFNTVGPTRGYVQPNATSAYLTVASSATADTELPASSMRNGSNFNYLIASITYRASA